MKMDRRQVFLMLIPLALSAFTHLWNPVGFPDIFYDEGVYMYRAMNVLSGQGPQVDLFHDHPYFGQLFLAGVLALTGYPNSLNPQHDAHSIQLLYTIPRIVMGLLAIVDTFLIYKISERRYSSNVALLASILFAVMPITWFLRRILLDSILLPFLLSSVLCAVYAKDSENKKLLVILCGIFFGITLFTKETAFTMIPLVAILVYQSTKKSKMVAIWFIPVILIPLLWPLQSVGANQFQYFVRDILFQVHKQNGDFSLIVHYFYRFDPTLLILSIAGTAYAAIKNDSLILLWVIPYVIFLASIGYVQYFYWIPILPILCIASAKLMLDTAQIVPVKIQRTIPLLTAVGFGVFGLVISSYLVTTNVSSQFDATAYVIQNVHNSDILNDPNNTTIVSDPVYSWIFKYVYHINDVVPDYRYLLFYPLYTHKVLLVDSPHFRANLNAGKQLQDLYNNTTPIKQFKGGVFNYDSELYPFTNLAVNLEGGIIGIRTNDHYSQSN